MTLIPLGPTLFSFLLRTARSSTQKILNHSCVFCTASKQTRETTDSNNTSPEQNIEVMIRCVFPLWPLGWAFIPASTTAASLSTVVQKRKQKRKYEAGTLETGSGSHSACEMMASD